MADNDNEPIDPANCWEAGDPDWDGCARTCMLPVNHAGEHGFQREDQIILELTDTRDTFSMAQARAWFEKWKAGL